MCFSIQPFLTLFLEVDKITPFKLICKITSVKSKVISPIQKLSHSFKSPFFSLAKIFYDIMKKILLLILVLIVKSYTANAQQFERYKKLCDTVIESSNLGFDKSITVTVPIEWQRNTAHKFPLIIVFDQQNQRSHKYILQTIDYLTSNEQMPSAVIISVNSENKYRFQETDFKISSPDGLALENEAFLFEELIPLTEEKYKVSNYRMLIGHSRYGYFTTALFFKRTNNLSAVISLSPFFTQKNISLTDSINRLNIQNFSHYKYYCFGIGNDYPRDYYAMDSAQLTLDNPYIITNSYFFKEADHSATPGLIIGSALYSVFEKWSNIQSQYLVQNSAMDSLTKAINTHYGSNLPFSLGILNGKGWDFYNSGNFEAAIIAWNNLLEYYPYFAEAYLGILDSKKMLGQNVDATVILFKNCLAKSEMYTTNEKQELLEELTKK